MQHADPAFRLGSLFSDSATSDLCFFSDFLCVGRYADTHCVAALTILCKDCRQGDCSCGPKRILMLGSDNAPAASDAHAYSHARVQIKIQMRCTSKFTSRFRSTFKFRSRFRLGSSLRFRSNVKRQFKLRDASEFRFKSGFLAFVYFTICGVTCARACAYFCFSYSCLH
jgi:hypothetical protein